MNHDTLLFRLNLILDSQAGFCSGCVSCYFVFTSPETLKPCLFAAKVYNKYNVIFGDFLTVGRQNKNLSSILISICRSSGLQAF